MLHWKNVYFWDESISSLMGPSWHKLFISFYFNCMYLINWGIRVLLFDWKVYLLEVISARSWAHSMTVSMPVARKESTVFNEDTDCSSIGNFECDIIDNGWERGHSWKEKKMVDNFNVGPFWHKLKRIDLKVHTIISSRVHFFKLILTACQLVWGYFMLRC